MKRYLFISLCLFFLAMGCSRQKAECLVYDSDTCLVRACHEGEQHDKLLSEANYKAGDQLFKMNVINRELRDGNCAVKDSKTNCYYSNEQFEKAASETKCEMKDPKLCVAETACEAEPQRTGWAIYTIWDKQTKFFATESEREDYLKSDEIVQLEWDEEDPIRKELSLPDNTIFVTQKIDSELQAKIKDVFAKAPASCVKSFGYYINVMTFTAYDSSADEDIECPGFDEYHTDDLYAIQSQDISVKYYINKYDFEYALRYLECKNMKNERWCINE